MLSRFHLIPERFGRTDRLTDGRTDRRTVFWRAIKTDPNSSCRCALPELIFRGTLLRYVRLILQIRRSICSLCCLWRWSIGSYFSVIFLHHVIGQFVLKFWKEIQRVLDDRTSEMEGGINKKLSCRRQTARSFVSLNILLSHSRSLEMTLLRRA